MQRIKFLDTFIDEVDTSQWLAQCYKQNINLTLLYAYRNTMHAKNDLLNFDSVVDTCLVFDICQILRDNNITEITISSNLSGLLDVLAEFEHQGFKVTGLVYVNANYLDTYTGKLKILPAIKMEM